MTIPIQRWGVALLENLAGISLYRWHTAGKEYLLSLQVSKIVKAASVQHLLRVDLLCRQTSKGGVQVDLSRHLLLEEYRDLVIWDVIDRWFSVRPRRVKMYAILPAKHAATGDALFESFSQVFLLRASSSPEQPNC